MKFLIFVFLLSILGTSAQEYKICKLAEHNAEWIKKLKDSKNLNEQVALIKQKISYDSIFIEKDTVWNNTNLIDKLHVNTEGFVQPAMVCVYSSTMVKDNEGNSCCDKIMFLVSSRKNLYLIDLQKDPGLTYIISEFKVQNISKVDLHFGNSMSVFGSKATEGVVIIRFSNNEVKKKLKKYFKQKRKAASD